jgi:hypothetical protein
MADDAWIDRSSNSAAATQCARAITHQWTRSGLELRGAAARDLQRLKAKRPTLEHQARTPSIPDSNLGQPPQGLNNSTAVEEFNARERRRLESSCIPLRRTTQISNGLTEPGTLAYELAGHVQFRCCPPNRGAFLIGRQADATKKESYVEKAKEAPKDHSAPYCGSPLPERKDHSRQNVGQVADVTRRAPARRAAGTQLL